MACELVNNDDEAGNRAIHLCCSSSDENTVPAVVKQLNFATLLLQCWRHFVACAIVYVIMLMMMQSYGRYQALVKSLQLNRAFVL